MALEYSAVVDALVYENLVVPDDLVPPPLQGEVWILGRRYSLPREVSEMTEDVRSRLWCTYRKNFKAISGTNITCDQGWGCTLRCGQMVMGNTLMLKHLGRDWRWTPKTKEQDTYQRILRKFLDSRNSDYSLQMIAHQGADFGRPIGQWFGPNNVAQALKKLSSHDSWSQLAVHVAMDMVVVVEDIKALCRQSHRRQQEVKVEIAEKERRRSVTAPSLHSTTITLKGGDILPDVALDPPMSGSTSDLLKRRRKNMTVHSAATGGGGEGMGEGVRGEEVRRKMPAVVRDELIRVLGSRGRSSAQTKPQDVQLSKTGRKRFRKGRGREDLIRSVDFERLAHMGCQENDCGDSEEEEEVEEEMCEGGGVREEGEGDMEGGFRSLLLFVPLRLGQEKFNMEYKEALKATFTLPQSVGIIGGKPRHALYFIGFHDDILLYLDPHTTQPTLSSSDLSSIPDHTYHCSRADRMHISELDPSIALAFFCRDEADIDSLCHNLRENVLSKMQYLFELTDKRPVYWGPLERNSITSVHEPFFLVDQAPPSPQFTCEEDSDGYEVIDYA